MCQVAAFLQNFGTTPFSHPASVAYDVHVPIGAYTMAAQSTCIIIQYMCIICPCLQSSFQITRIRNNFTEVILHKIHILYMSRQC